MDLQLFPSNTQQFAIEKNVGLMQKNVGLMLSIFFCKPDENTINALFTLPRNCFTYLSNESDRERTENRRKIENELLVRSSGFARRELCRGAFQVKSALCYNLNLDLFQISISNSGANQTRFCSTAHSTINTTRTQRSGERN